MNADSLEMHNDWLACAASTKKTYRRFRVNNAINSAIDIQNSSCVTQMTNVRYHGSEG